MPHHRNIIPLAEHMPQTFEGQTEIDDGNGGFYLNPHAGELSEPDTSTHYCSPGVILPLFPDGVSPDSDGIQ